MDEDQAHDGAEQTRARDADAARPSGPDSGAAQLQAAALEAVRATRALLDMAEALIREPGAIESVVDTITAAARAAGGLLTGGAAGPDAERTSPATPHDVADPADDDGVQRIRVD